MAPENGTSQHQELFVSGRLCLFGEHSDWAGEFHEHNPDIAEGTTVIVGTQEGLFARAHALQQDVFMMESTREDGQPALIELPLAEADLLKEAQTGSFFSYAAGTAFYMLQKFGKKLGGLKIHNYKTTLPMAKGLSSSAAICVMVARAFSSVYKLGLSIRDEMEMAYQGEIITPSKCGRMDQACAFGAVPVVMKFKGSRLDVHDVRLSVPLFLVLVDLGAAKDTIRILTALQEAYPVAKQEQHHRMQELLGNVNNGIVERVLQAMAAGDAQAVGALMAEAQREFDARAAPLCPDQLTSPLLHKVLAYPSLRPLTWGGKGIGSQGDGSAQLLCKDEATQAQACKILESELSMTARPLTVRANASR